MPCCKCIQTLLRRRKDGALLVVFEHTEDERDVWFAGMEVEEMVLAGTSCDRVRLPSGVALTWKVGERHLTVIGRAKEAEFGQLIPWLGSGIRPTSG